MSSGDAGLWYERPDGYGMSSYSSGYGYGGAVSDLGWQHWLNRSDGGLINHWLEWRHGVVRNHGSGSSMGSAGPAL